MLLAAAGMWTGNLSGQVPDRSDQAQPRSSSRTISGIVLDPSGAAIANANVSLTDSDSKLQAQASTDNNGAFHFGSVVPGKYMLEVKAEGFRPSTVSTTVAGRRSATVRITMQISIKTETVTVASGNSAPLVSTETSENQNANTVDRAALDRVPVFDQDYITTMSRFLDDNATGTNGVTLVVNGIEANGPGVTPSAIQEVKINNNPYSARFSRPGRARLEIVTKGGSAAYHGSVNAMFRDSVFDASNAFATSGKPPERREYFEGSVSGPLAHSKRTSFLLSLDDDVLDQQNIMDVAAIQAAETAGFGPFAQTVPNPTHHFFGSGRVFHDLVKGDQFWIGYSYEHRSSQNANIGGTIMPSAATDTHFLEHEINVSDLHSFSPHWVNQARFLVGHFDSQVHSVDPSAQEIALSEQFTVGGAQADTRRTEYHFDGTDFATYASGKHQVSFGIDIPDISRRGLDDFTNRAGTYTFADEAHFQSKAPAVYLLQT